jgi:hypothetical protein
MEKKLRNANEIRFKMFPFYLAEIAGLDLQPDPEICANGKTMKPAPKPE